MSGITFEYDRNRAAGDRVLRIELEDGTVLFDSGFVIADIKVDIATINFLANGQDGYPFPALGLGFDALGITYQQALFNYITQGLDGVIGGDRYSQAFADGLIVQTPEPGSLAILGLGGLALFVSRKRRKAA
ncbi:MAG: PEP-CTERM sorting domain-containing protein [Sphingomonadales bacterium]|nr:MAG: PEP-CTERM sorting domain-containing protein [Sphingomonadales bacterium]